MNIDELDELKARVAERYEQSPGVDLEGMIQDFRAYLPENGLLTVPIVRKTGGRFHLVEAVCNTTRPNITSTEVVNELERVWQAHLRYDDFEAHAVVINESSIIFDFLTVARDAKLYMTGMILVNHV